ncbi:MAG: hypothetical protein GY771_09360, partial [bacterium]|nr:hypothetical protein [bacterium]
MNRLLYIPPVLLAVAISVNAADIEDIDMGEAKGYRYFARIIEKTGNDLIGSVTGEVMREKGNISETVATFDVPYPSCCEAGIYPDGGFYYLAGHIPGGGSNPERFICVFETGVTT